MRRGTLAGTSGIARCDSGRRSVPHNCYVTLVGTKYAYSGDSESRGVCTPETTLKKSAGFSQTSEDDHGTKIHSMARS
jgi:hypothetical protein